MNTQPQGGARQGLPEVDDVARTLVWQKQHEHGNGGPPPAAGRMGATALNNMGLTAVGMPPEFEEDIRAGAAASAVPSANTLLGIAHGAAPAQPGLAAHPAAPSPARVPGARPPPPADPAARTLVGVSMPGSGFNAQAQANTARQLPSTAKQVSPPGAAAAAAASAPGSGASTLPARVLGAANAAGAGPVPPARASAPRSSGSPALAPQPAHRDHAQTNELGATMAPGMAAHNKMPGMREGPPPSRKKHPLDRRLVVGPKKSSKTNRTGMFAIAGGVVALVAVLVVVFWPSRGAVSAQPRVDNEGRDGLDVECPSCPDATTVRIGSSSAAILAHHAFVPITLPLGESKLEVVLDRPGGGKDEVASVSVHMPYRVLTDLATLRGERPSIQVVVEAQAGTQVTLDGKSIPLVNGRAIDMLDVTDACTGESDEPRTLSRQIPYTVTPPGGSPEQGTLHISVPIVPLRITAPGAAVVTDKESFVLAGRTAKGIELFAGPHTIPLRPDGSFAHVMNVSAVGATQIFVRAQAPSMAPRIIKVDVRRVDSLESAARDFASKTPLLLADLATDPKTKLGKNAMVAGLVLGTKSAEQITVLRLRGYGGPACPPLPPGARPEAVGETGPCLVEIAVGAQVTFAPGDLVTGCGRFAGTTGEPGSEVPQVRADFVVKGLL